MAVARGDALIKKVNGSSLAGDLIGGHFIKDAHGQSVLKTIESQGHVVVTTLTDIVHGDEGVYDIDAKRTVLFGNVRASRGDNTLEGASAEVNMTTGISQVFPGEGQRVRGLFVHQQQGQPDQPQQNSSGKKHQVPSSRPPKGTGPSRPRTPPAHSRTSPETPRPTVPAEVAAKPAATELVTTTGPRLVTANSGLVARHLGKQFKRRPVLRDVTVTVQRGEAVGLLGPNGAGKTTCFYIITGLINADTGTIELDGTDITHLPMYRRSRLGIGYLPQEASIFRGLTVEENIRAVLEVVEPERDVRESTLDDLLAEFSISHLRRTPALALSGGERRRVEIARALASRPQFMLLDEPLAGIDPIAIGEIRDLISHLRQRGIGVLITDHNVRETLDIVDRAYILHDGSVLMDGRPSEIVAHQDVRRVYLGEKFSL
jgi:lipopolysaccharide export system ATP-binding protein